LEIIKPEIGIKQRGKCVKYPAKNDQFFFTFQIKEKLFSYSINNKELRDRSLIIKFLGHHFECGNLHNCVGKPSN
jgi:hypothetical protein